MQPSSGMVLPNHVRSSLEPSVSTKRVAAAAFGLGTALFGLALPRPGPAPVSCPNPREIRGNEIRSVEVTCDPAERARLPLRGAAKLLFASKLDLNCEAAETLEALPGIGPVRAAAIVAARPFSTLTELKRVHGIGPRTVAGLTGWAEAFEASADGLLCRPPCTECPPVLDVRG